MATPVKALLKRISGVHSSTKNNITILRQNFATTDLGIIILRRYISEDPIGFLSGEPNFFAYVSDTNAWVDLLGLEGSTYANARKMTDEEIARFFGDEKWHKTKEKQKYLKIFEKEMKGDTNADFHINNDTNDIYLKTNEKEIWINTGDKLE